MVKWSVPARNDLKQIYDYISKDSKYYAQNVIQEIVAKTETLIELPEIGV
jgi:toxin ParE1/3/4